MGNLNSLNQAFDHGQGGTAAGGSPEDWGGGGGLQPGQGRGTPGGTPDAPSPQKPEAPPPIPKYVQPVMYAPKQSQLQRTTYNPNSTSHDYLSRFSVSKHF